MKILYHHRTRAEDAQGIHIAAMVHAFRDLGHEVRVVSLMDSAAADASRGRRLSAATRSAPAAVYEALSLAYNLYGYRHLTAAARQWRPDLIYERYALNTFCGVWAQRRCRVPLILEVNSPLAFEQDALGALTFKRLARFSERWILSHSARTIVVSQAMKDMLAERGVPPSHMSVIHNGIDPREFHPGIDGGEVRHRHGLDGSVVVGFAGWFRPWHGLDALLREMHGAGLFAQGVRLLLVGEGPANEQLRSLVRERDLAASVIFAGAVPRQEMAAHSAAMDVAMQPSAVAYASPMKIFEYMAMARCIVAPDQANIREILTDERDALLFTPGDGAGLQRQLVRAIGDASLRRRLGEQARRTLLEQRLLWSANAERVTRLVAELRSPPGRVDLGMVGTPAGRGEL